MVYRARHALLRRPTAVKLLQPDKAGVENLLRFEREVQLTATLSHPSTVVIFDYGRTPEGVFYYAMEYLDGLDLERLVRVDGPQPAGRIIHILAQVCGALAEAHDAGLIHRDVKPANIILTERGGMPDIPKVVDFGLVKQFATLGSADTATTVVGVTAANTIVGTPLYLSPEAITGRDLDGRSDLYALGAVGYYLLTGEPVFSATSIVEVSAHHLHSVPVPPVGTEPAPGACRPRGRAAEVPGESLRPLPFGAGAAAGARPLRRGLPVATRRGSPVVGRVQKLAARKRAASVASGRIWPAQEARACSIASSSTSQLRRG